ncbi:sulfurtransferase [Geomonas sp. Red276]
MERVSCAQVVALQKVGAVLLDVMTPEDYACCHISGASNACIYEVVFLERVKEAVPDPTSAVVVYDASGSTRAGTLAVERLRQAGYEMVYLLEGGLAAWFGAGLPVKGTGTDGRSEPALADGRYRIDSERSSLEWIGRNFNNRHHGRIPIIEGSLAVRGQGVAEGRVVADMAGISNFDLQDPAWHDLLIAHLKSDDFFAVDRFPTAEFRLTTWEPGRASSVEVLDGAATGELTIRDVTRRIVFPASLAPQPDGTVKAHALLEIDRTLWNVGYGSAKWYERLGMHLVHDLITIELFLCAVRE